MTDIICTCGHDISEHDDYCEADKCFCSYSGDFLLRTHIAKLEAHLLAIVKFSSSKEYEEITADNIHQYLKENNLLED